MSADETARGRILLNSIERLLDVYAVEYTVARIRASTQGRDEASRRVISHYANHSAIAGAVSAAPCLVPGWGTVVAIGLTLGELAYVMKVEVEMCLALCAIHGHECRSDKTRQLALALAAVQVHCVEAGRNVALDAGEITVQALGRYTPRELGKLAVTMLGKVACTRAARSVGKGLLHAIPVVGSIVGLSVNSLLTRRVGKAAHLALEQAGSCPVGA
jgi:uncharacterized protein (DUF697 family)